jgi:selenide,water dikinase
MIASMTTLNADASHAALAAGARCATDITGFGLLGHASHIARASGVTLRIRVASLPVLPGTRDAWAAGARTGGAERNEEFLADRVRWGALGDGERAILVDPQTSGGLLVAVPAPAVADYLSRVVDASVIGEVVPREDVDIDLS